MSLENEEILEELGEQESSVDNEEELDVTDFYLQTITNSGLLVENDINDEELVDSLEDFYLGEFTESEILQNSDIGEEFHESSENLDLDDITKFEQFDRDIDEELSEGDESLHSVELTKSEILEDNAREEEFDLQLEESRKSEQSLTESDRTDEEELVETNEDLEESTEATDESQNGIDEFAYHPLVDLSDEEIVKIVENLQNDVKHLQLENQIFVNVLQQTEPSILEDMDIFIKNKQTLRHRSQRSSQNIDHNKGTSFRVSFTQRSDLVLRETDEAEMKLNNLQKKSYRIKCDLKANIQEINIRRSELDETVACFEDFFTINDEQTIQRIPIEKFIRFMKDSMRKTIITTDQIRLRISSLKKHYNRTRKQQTDEHIIIQTVDFEQLQIKTKHHQQQMKLKSNLLKDLRKINGLANLSLSNQKESLLKNEKDLKKIKNDITVKGKKVVKIEKECDKAAEKLEQTKNRYNKIKEQAKMYKLPDIMDYIKITKAN